MNGSRGALGGSLLVAAAGQAGLMATGILVARMLGVDDRGRFALFSVLAGIFGLVAAAGAPSGVTYFLARGADANAVRRIAVRLILVQAAIVLPVQAVVCYLVFRHDSAGIQHAAWFSVPVVFASVVQAYSLAIIQGQQRFGALNLFRLTVIGTYGTGVAIAFATGWHSLFRVTAVWMVASLLGALISAANAYRGLRKPAQESPLDVTRGEILRFGFRGALGSTSPMDALRLDQAITGLLLSPHALGLYVVATAFTNMPRFIGQSVGLIAYPSIARERSVGPAHRAIARFLVLGAGLSLLVVLGIELVVPRLVILFYGSSFDGASTVTRLLLPAAFFAGFRKLLSDCAQGSGFPLLGSIAEFVLWAGLVPGLLVLPARYGVNGVAIAMVFASGLACVVLLASFVAVLRTPDFGRRLQSRMSVASGRSWRAAGRGLVLVVGLCLLSVGVGAAPVFASPGRLIIVVGTVLLASTAVAIAAVWSPRKLGTLLLLCGVLTLSMTRLRVHGPIKLSDAFFVLAGLVLLPGVQVARVLVSAIQRRMVIGVLLLVVGGTLGSMFAADTHASLVNLLKLFAASGLLMLIVSAWAPTAREVQACTAVWVASAAVSAAWALFLPPGHGRRAAGLADHPTGLALTCVLSLGPALLLMRVGSRAARISAAGAIFLLLGGILVSGSRAGLLAAAIEVTLAMVFARRRLFVIATFASVVGVSTLLDLAPKFTSFSAVNRLLSPSSSSSISNAAHQSALDSSLSAIAAHPLTGGGFQNAEGALNVYLQVMASGGAFAIIGFLLVGAAAVRPLLAGRAAITLQDDGFTAAIVGLSVGFLGFLIADLFQNPIWERYIWFAPALIAVGWSAAPVEMTELVLRRSSHEQSSWHVPIPDASALR